MCFYIISCFIFISVAKTYFHFSHWNIKVLCCDVKNEGRCFHGSAPLPILPLEQDPDCQPGLQKLLIVLASFGDDFTVERDIPQA